MNESVLDPELVAATLPALLAHLAEVRPGRPLDEQDDHVRAYLNGLFDVGRARYLYPELAERQDMALFRRETGTLLTAASTAVMRYMIDTENALDGPWESDESLRVARRRSSIAFLADLTSPGWQPDTSLLDERLRARWEGEGGLAAPDEIPEGVPPSHWWWRLPGTEADT
jgi:hypothetical protein